MSVNKEILNPITNELEKITNLEFEHSDYKNLPYDKVEQLYMQLVNRIGKGENA